MTTARYSAYMVAGISGTEAFPINTGNFMELLSNSNNFTFTYGGGTNFYPELSEKTNQARATGKSNIIVKVKNYHTCRETLLSAVRIVGKSASYVNLISSSLRFYVLYETLDSMALSRSYKEKIFKFIANSGLPFSSYILDQGVLIYLHKYDMQYLWKLSLILFCIRNVKIMDDVLAKFPERVAGNTFLNYMSQQFLLNPYWGDDFNNHLLLSTYCYAEYNGGFITADSSYNGPCSSASSNIRADVMYDYITDIYVPCKGTDRIRMGPYVSESFTKNFINLLDLYTYRHPEKKEEKSMPSETMLKQKSPKKIVIDFQGLE
jgi:hypothetical protein